MTAYLIVSTIIFAFFGMIWRTSTFTNVMFKFVMIAMALFGAVLSLQSLGYIINT